MRAGGSGVSVARAAIIALALGGCWLRSQGEGSGGPPINGFGGSGGSSSSSSTGPVCGTGDKRACYDGPHGSDMIPPCKAGVQTCDGNGWGGCVGEVLPARPNCATVENEACEGIPAKCTGKPNRLVTFGGQGSDTPTSLVVDASRNVIVGGRAGSGINLGPSTMFLGAGDAFFAQIDPVGSVHGGMFGGVGIDTIASLALDPKGALTAVGYFDTAITSTLCATPGQVVSNRAFLATLDPVAPACPALETFVGAGSQEPVAIAYGPKGELALGGAFSGDIAFGALPKLTGSQVDVDAFVAVREPDGKYRWSRSFGASPGFDVMRAVGFDANGDLWVAMVANGLATIDFDGQKPIPGGLDDVVVMKLAAADGHVMHVVRYGDGEVQDVNALAVDPSGGVVVGGFFRGVMDLGSGNKLLADAFGDGFVLAFDAAGSLRWSQQLGDANSADQVNAVAIDHVGNIVVAGQFSASLSKLPTPLVAKGASPDAFVAKLDPTGMILWDVGVQDAKTAMLPSQQTIAALAITETDGIVATGTFFGPTAFGVMDATPPANNLEDVFVLWLDP
jgi:outer membrane protein assembly factor BamB